MIEGVAFQTRARTIDHLGRGQIADAPTAVSELWKNAYDAYAKNVALHIFDGNPEIAAIFDDGIGMSRKDVLERWLVIGTESKFDESEATPIDTLGLPIRPRQGEKGIGRLSVAFLAPATILISKRANSDFVAIVVDWRLFENPYLALDDIHLPVQTFRSADDLVDGLPPLLNMLKANLGGKGSEREKRLAASWKRFSEYEAKQSLPSTQDTIASVWKTMPLSRRHLEEWPVFLGLVEHGTAIFMVGLNNELGVWVRPDEAGEEVDEAKERLLQTLTAFTDPYSKDRPIFDYEIFVHRGDNDRRLLGASEVFGLDGLHDLEHFIEGEFDARGTFTGRIVAFGQDLGTKTFQPARPLSTKGRDRLGPFTFAIGTFEQDERRSTHDANQHALLDQQAEKFAGMFVYRDFLRVMPYGRPNADFLGMEERRSKHAGREFWAHRRSFGRIGFTRLSNPALRDKAGREGLVDNRAFREMRILVIQFLQDAARKYFGTDAPLRIELMPGIMERKALQKEAADKARARRRKGMRQFLKEQSAPLEDAIQRADMLIELAKDTLSKKDKTQATVLAARVRDIRLVSDVLRPPTPPSRLGDLEVDWRNYRDGFEEFTKRLQTLAAIAAEVEAAIQSDKPKDVLLRHYEEQRGVLVGQLHQFVTTINDRLTKLGKKWTDQSRADEEEIESRIGHLLTAKVNTGNLLGMINLLDASRAELSDTFANRYQSIISALEQLIEGIDLQGAVDITSERQDELEEQLRDIQAVAQIGITVEIIGHEFETLESEVKRNLAKLPLATRQTEAYKQALRSHQALADRLRFLAPLKIGGYRSRETITGQQIADYISEFFSTTFKDQRIDFLATAAFRKIAITDIPSRIYPVFINLVNNAVYWASQSSERKIRLDFKDGLAVVADSGPGVDPEDVSRLFNIFFTKRRSGRGVGLYLSRANLSVAGHKIRYATGDDPKVLAGANFIIDFKGVRDNG
ncbi:MULTISPECIES: ATP-binding protein [unclassified Bradyrhizobium]|uniref:ATP-binding protein n=1 Tax=unclassified Bradyrhizobium TaxID=2631580 RepID=UPI0029169C25|nr:MULTISPECIES: ATP-binding protein [unclassified Bradyrhizobium]